MDRKAPLTVPKTVDPFVAMACAMVRRAPPIAPMTVDHFVAMVYAMDPNPVAAVQTIVSKVNVRFALRLESHAVGNVSTAEILEAEDACNKIVWEYTMHSIYFYQ